MSHRDSLTVLQAVELLRNKRAHELSLAERRALAELVERNPACCSLLGGREHVDQYLSDALSVDKLPTPVISEPPNLQVRGPRRWLPIFLAILVAGGFLFVLAGTFLILWMRPHRVHRPSKPLVTPHMNVRVRPLEPKTVTPPNPGLQQSEASGVMAAPATPAEVAGPPPQKKLETLGDGWVVEPDPETVIVRKTEWLLDDPANPRPGVGYGFGAHPVKIGARRQIDSAKRWLRLRLAPVEGWEPGGMIELRVDGQRVARAEIEPAMFQMPVLASLEPYVGKDVLLELHYAPANGRSALSFKSIDLVEHTLRVKWMPLVPTTAEALFGATLTTLPDHSILAGGVDADNEIYRVTVAMPPQGAVAIRIEAIMDASLPEQGPGRGNGGSFFLSQVSAVEADSIQAKDKIRARHVKVFGIGRSEILSLAEVEVYCGGQNVALKKNATQSSVSFDAPAALAVDGNHSGDFNLKTVTHSQNEPVTWWAVDLGQEFDIDRVVVWNRTDCLSTRLANHRVQLLDAGGQVLWEYLNPRAPFPQAVYGPFVTAEKRVYFSEIKVGGRSTSMDNMAITYWDHPGVGSNNGQLLNTATAMLQLSQEPTLANERITIELTQGGPQFKRNLGRFRLTATAAKPPYDAEPPVYILPTDGK